MLFKPELINAIVRGEKTQTRRVRNANEWLGGGAFEMNGKHLVSPYAVYIGTMPHERLKWMVGRDYAVQPKMGKPCVWWHPENLHVFELQPDSDKGILRENGYKPLRIRITDIHRESLQDIDAFGVNYEGILLPEKYVSYNNLTRPEIEREMFRKLWDSLATPATRWNANPDVWVLTFEIVR
jgi:hypothetical protein